MKRLLLLMICAMFTMSLFTSCAKAEKSLSAAELLDLGEKYLLELDYEQAIVHFTKLIEIEPKNPRAYTGLAEAYAALGQTDKAIDTLHQGLEQLPDHADIIHMLDELTKALEPMPVSTPTPEPAPTPASNANMPEAVLNAYLYKDFSYSFEWGNDKLNQDSLGTCWLSLSLSGDIEGVGEVLISNWKEGTFTHEEIVDSASWIVPIWKNEDIDGSDFTGDFKQGHPVFENELGKAVSVLLIVLDKNIDAIGHIVVQTQTPVSIE